MFTLKSIKKACPGVDIPARLNIDSIERSPNFR